MFPLIFSFGFWWWGKGRYCFDPAQKQRMNCKGQSEKFSWFSTTTGFPPLYLFSHQEQHVQKPTRKPALPKQFIVLKKVTKGRVIQPTGM